MLFRMERATGLQPATFDLALYTEVLCQDAIETLLQKHAHTRSPFSRRLRRLEQLEAIADQSVEATLVGACPHVTFGIKKHRA